MRYRVKRHSEEFECPTCGAPVYVGDTAYQDGEAGPVYCSAYCAGADHARQKPLKVASGGMPAATWANCQASAGA